MKKFQALFAGKVPQLLETVLILQGTTTVYTHAALGKVTPQGEEDGQVVVEG